MNSANVLSRLLGKLSAVQDFLISEASYIDPCVCRKCQLRLLDRSLSLLAFRGLDLLKIRATVQAGAHLEMIFSYLQLDLTGTHLVKMQFVN